MFWHRLMIQPTYFNTYQPPRYIPPPLYGVLLMGPLPVSWRLSFFTFLSGAGVFLRLLRYCATTASRATPVPTEMMTPWRQKPTLQEGFSAWIYNISLNMNQPRPVDRDVNVNGRRGSLSRANQQQPEPQPGPAGFPVDDLRDPPREIVIRPLNNSNYLNQMIAFKNSLPNSQRNR
ncbi:unnamed protein product [Nesidiocoris tenuis]|uniref:Uncharacterized protein n=1 Tax=Nesidiocoris tenuis TaxID=355587 RepID=A0A6H5HBY2_9HEMI|nr:unnamed protein product [Nesidiocoris tenuis]